MNNIRNYLLTALIRKEERSKISFNRLQWNGSTFCLRGLHPTRDKDAPGLHLEVRESDYYTYRTLADCSRLMIHKTALRKKLRSGLLNYLDNDSLPEMMHGGVGILVIVHCRVGNYIIIRRRSKRVAAYKDAGKFAPSANEGLNINDLEKNSYTRLASAEEWVTRALEEELVGTGNIGTKRGQIPMHACYWTGVLLYLPNLTVNLSFVASLECDLETLLVATSQARDSGFEYDQKLYPVRFTFTDLSRFLRKTVNNSASIMWDEGALAAVGMALPLAGRI
jgi:hypothetical protein